MSQLVWPLLLLIALSVRGDRTPGQNSTNRIIGGSSVDILEAPHQANIVVDGNPCCSGAIIDSKRILTAAGCVYGCPTSSVRVRVGSSSREGGGILAEVCGINIHPEYSTYRYDNNLAILELCEHLMFTNSIKSIDVAEKVPTESSLAEVTGWGSTSWWGSWWDRTFGSLPDQLQAATVSFYNREQCAYDLSSWFWDSDFGVSDLTLCTYSYNKAACSYDTGAPLVKDKKLVGILSYGGCTTYPDVYANLIRFRNWLSLVVTADDKETTTTKATSPSTTTKIPAGSTGPNTTLAGGSTEPKPGSPASSTATASSMSSGSTNTTPSTTKGSTTSSGSTNSTASTTTTTTTTNTTPSSTSTMSTGSTNTTSSTTKGSTTSSDSTNGTTSTTTTTTTTNTTPSSTSTMSTGSTNTTSSTTKGSTTSSDSTNGTTSTTTTTTTTNTTPSSTSTTTTLVPGGRGLKPKGNEEVAL